MLYLHDWTSAAKPAVNPCAPIITEKSTKRQKPCGLVMNCLPHQSWLELFSLVSSFSRASSPWVLHSHVPCPSPPLTPASSVRGTQGSQPVQGWLWPPRPKRRHGRAHPRGSQPQNVPWCRGRSAQFPNHPLAGNVLSVGLQDTPSVATQREFWKWGGRKGRQWELGIFSVKSRTCPVPTRCHSCQRFWQGRWHN